MLFYFITDSFSTLVNSIPGNQYQKSFTVWFTERSWSWQLEHINNCVHHRSVLSVFCHDFTFLLSSNYETVYHWNFCLCFHDVPPMLATKFGARKDEPLHASQCVRISHVTGSRFIVDLCVCIDTQMHRNLFYSDTKAAQLITWETILWDMAQPECRPDCVCLEPEHDLLENRVF